MRHLIVALTGVVAIAANAPAVSVSSAAQYSVLSNGEKVGHVDVQRSGRTLDIDYAVSNNGRGPAVTEHLVLDARGIPEQ